MKKWFLFCSLWSFAAVGQQKITVKMPLANPNQYVHLAHYYGSKQLSKVDSVKVGSDGLLRFQSPEGGWKGGLYMVLLSPSKFYDLVVSGKEDDIYMEFDTTDYVNSVKFKGSKENEVMFNYRKFLTQKMKVGESLQKQLGTETNPSKVSTLQRQLDALGKEVNGEIKRVIDANPDLFASKLLRANIEPEIPTEIPILPNGKKDSTYAYRVYKAKFFDGLDFSDERMIRTPFLESKLDRYFSNLVYQKTDSLKKETTKVLEMSKKNKDIYRYTLWYITNKYETTDVVGLDGVIIHLYENFYLKDADWLEQSTLDRFRERLNIMKPLETGKVLPELVLKDAEGKIYQLSQQKAKYTIVNFYSPTCGHCKDSAPALVKFQDENKSKGIVVWNVATDQERDLEEMKKFIKEYDTSRLINVYDPDKKYDFFTKYDVYSTPTVYILDEKKRIIGRRIPIEEVLNFIAHYEKNGL